MTGRPVPCPEHTITDAPEPCPCCDGQGSQVRTDNPNDPRLMWYVACPGCSGTGKTQNRDQAELFALLRDQDEEREDEGNEREPDPSWEEGR